MFKIYLVNAKNMEKGLWLDLPIREEELEEAKEELLGLDDDGYLLEDELIILKFENKFDYDVKKINIDKLNELAERIELIEEKEDILEAAIEEFRSLEEAVEAVEDEKYFYLTGITSEEDLGWEYVRQGLFCEEIPNCLKRYIDYSAIGHDLIVGGDFVIYENLEIAIMWK